MFEIIAIVFDAAEGYTAKAMDLQDKLGAGGRSANVDVGFLTHANAIACAVEGGAFEVGVEGKIVETAVREAIAVI